jgi:hypothetical protein
MKEIKNYTINKLTKNPKGDQYVPREQDILKRMETLEIKQCEVKGCIMTFAVENEVCIYLRRDFLESEKHDSHRGENAQKGYEQALKAGLI